MELAISVGCCNAWLLLVLYYLLWYATFIPASQGRIAQMADFSELYRQLYKINISNFVQ